jgi:hypothetical protein
LIRVALICIVRLTDRQRSGSHGGPAIALLHHVRELVRQEPAPTADFGHVLSHPEHNVPANGERACLDGLRRFCSRFIYMNSDLGEVGSEARLHESASRGVERLSRRAQRLVHDRRRGRIAVSAAGKVRRAAAGAFALQRRQSTLQLCR